MLTLFLTKNKIFKNQLIEKPPKKGFLQRKIDFAFCTTMFIVFWVLLQGCISRLENSTEVSTGNNILQGCISRLERYDPKFVV